MAPFPGRWPEALVVAGAVTTAVAVAVALQVPSFAAPNVACLALQHTTVCTWRNMVGRLLVLVVAALVLVPVGSVLLQAPWLLVPAFFLMIATLTYVLPFAGNPVESVLIAFTLVGVCFSGTYDPSSIVVQTRDLVAACAIGVVSATVFAQLAARPSARLRLAESLSVSFARSERILGEAIARLAAEEPAEDWPEAPVHSDLGRHVPLLQLARQEDMGPLADRTLVALSTAAERAAVFVGTVDTVSRQKVAHTYREAMRAEIEAAAGDVAWALREFARAALALASRETLAAPGDDAPWPEFDGCVARLRERQDELRGGATMAAVGVAESINLNALVQALAGLADVLHTPPWDLRDLAAEEQLGAAPPWPFQLPHVDPFALRFALQVALGVTIALVVGIASHEPELSTLLWNPLLVAQTSYGATIRKAWLRLAGVVAGGVLSLLTMVLVFANTSDLTALLAVVFAVVVACQYAALGMPVTWYAPFQVTVTYFVVLIAAQPATDVTAALWRAFGTFAGTAILFTVFRVVAPDYAGRQLIARFAHLLRSTLRNLPEPGVPLPSPAELISARVAAARASADILRLIGEARLEGAGSGIQPDAAIEAAGVSLRISLRAGLVTRGRVTTGWASNPAPPLSAALERMHATLRAHLAHDLAMIDARQTMAPPGSRTHDLACEAARTHCTRARRPAGTARRAPRRSRTRAPGGAARLDDRAVRHAARGGRPRASHGAARAAPRRGTGAYGPARDGDRGGARDRHARAALRRRGRLKRVRRLAHRGRTAGAPVRWNALPVPSLVVGNAEAAV